VLVDEGLDWGKEQVVELVSEEVLECELQALEDVSVFVVGRERGRVFWGVS
jgi:hypothetical protein